MICKPCYGRGANNDAVVWCSDCEEALCIMCKGAHKRVRLTRNHSLMDIALRPGTVAFLDQSFKCCKIHDESAFDSFCEWHEEPCCQLCRTEKHRNCTIRKLDDAVKEEYGNFFKKLSTDVDELLNAVTQLDKEKNDNKSLILSQEKDIKEQTAKSMQRFINHIQMFESKIYTELQDQHEQTCDMLQRLDNSIFNIEKSTKDYKNRIEFVTSYGSNIQAFIIAHRIKEQLSLTEKELLKCLSNVMTYGLSLKSGTEKLFSKSMPFGSLFLKTGSSNIIYKPMPYIQAQTCLRKVVRPFNDILSSVRTKKGFRILGTVFASGIVSIDKIHLIICNFSLWCIYKYNTNGQRIKDCEMMSNPHGIAIIPNTNKAVVTLPKIKTIQFVDTVSMLVTGQKKIFCEGVGVSAIKDLIIIGGKDELCLLDTDGNHQMSIPLRPHPVFKLTQNSVQFIQFINKESVVYTDTEGIYRIEFKEFYHGNKAPKIDCLLEIYSAQGITADRQGNIYVAINLQNKITKVSADGRCSSQVLGGLDRPWALCFHDSTSRLFVSDQDGEFVTFIDLE